MFEGLSAEDAKPDFDLVEPARVRRREVKMDVRMAGEPGGGKFGASRPIVYSPQAAVSATRARVAFIANNNETRSTSSPPAHGSRGLVLPRFDGQVR